MHCKSWVFYNYLTVMIRCFLFFLLFWLQGHSGNSYKPENLGRNINTHLAELMPQISPDGKTLFFVRECFPGGEQDIWYSQLQSDSSWSRAVNIGRPLNTPEHNAVCSIMPDGKRLLLSNTYYRNGRMGIGASITRKIGRGWSFPENLSFRRLENKSEFINFFLANDARTMLLELEGPDSRGKQDLYVSFLEDEKLNAWSEPLNLGDNINTVGYEISPFLAADNKTLYFASSGHPGFGHVDIFISRRLDSTWTSWSTPVNLGPSINTPYFDAYFSIPTSGEYAYFASDREGYGRSDIFRVRLPPELRPESVVILSGKVLHANTHKPIPAIIRYELLPKAQLMGYTQCDPQNGEFKITLPLKYNYAIYAEAEGYLGTSQYLNLSTAPIKDQHLKELLLLYPLEKNQIIRFNNICFQSGSTKLEPDFLPELNRILKILQQHPKMIIEIGGHTDNIGSEEQNKLISLQRAEAVRNYFLQKGISPKRIVAKGYGAQQPLADNKTSEGRKKNRRVEFKILKK
ncbi:MAG: OmpA family protein [Bacteroidia bacterium]|nr:OmpA family protein [Bacteroidia bacterium]MDW8159700.1 OmpA family protein [Bacteroidia bacterium]